MGCVGVSRGVTLVCQTVDIWAIGSKFSICSIGSVPARVAGDPKKPDTCGT